MSYDGKIDIGLVPFLMECAESCEFMSVVHRPTDVARNQVVARALRNNQHIMFVDADSNPALGTFKALYEVICNQVAVCCCPYVSSSGNICVGEISPGVREVEKLTGYTKVNNCGTHTVMYNREVFRLVDAPWYEYHYNKDRTQLAGYAEDTVLHRKLVKVGVEIYCCWDKWSEHVVSRVMGKPRTLTEGEKRIFLLG